MDRTRAKPSVGTHAVSPRTEDGLGVFASFVKTMEGRAPLSLKSVIESARLLPGKCSMATVSGGRS